MIEALPLRLPVTHQGTQVPQTQQTPAVPTVPTVKTAAVKKDRGRQRKKARNG